MLVLGFVYVLLSLSWRRLGLGCVIRVVLLCVCCDLLWLFKFAMVFVVGGVVVCGCCCACAVACFGCFLSGLNVCLSCVCCVVCCCCAAVVVSVLGLVWVLSLFCCWVGAVVLVFCFVWCCGVVFLLSLCGCCFCVRCVLGCGVEFVFAFVLFCNCLECVLFWGEGGVVDVGVCLFVWCW